MNYLLDWTIYLVHCSGDSSCLHRS